MSTVAKPVTVTAETDVNKESKRFSQEPLLFAIGSESRNAPTAIITVKAMAIRRVGCTPRRLRTELTTSTIRFIVAVAKSPLAARDYSWAVTRVFIFDGDCAFCSSAARVMRKMTGEVTPIKPYQKLDLPSLGLSSELTSKAVYYVRDGKYLVAADAIAQLLLDSKRIWMIFGLFLKLPLVKSLARVVYYWIAKNRHKLPGGRPECKLD